MTPLSCNSVRLDAPHLKAQAHQLSLAEFVNLAHEAVLVVSAFESQSDQGFVTMTGLKRSLAPDQLLKVRKREGANAFSMMITIGRAANNDLVLTAGSVSKFHGYFVHDGEGMSLVDAGSSQGTLVNGERLEARVKTRLRDGDMLRFGELSARFLLPTGLHAYLRETPF